MAHAQAPYSLILWQNGNFLHRLTDSPAGVTWITDIVACLQIQTSRQRAIMLVHAYPFVTHKDKLVSVLAEQHGSPQCSPCFQISPKPTSSMLLTGSRP